MRLAALVYVALASNGLKHTATTAAAAAAGCVLSSPSGQSPRRWVVSCGNDSANWSLDPADASHRELVFGSVAAPLSTGSGWELPAAVDAIGKLESPTLTSLSLSAQTSTSIAIDPDAFANLPALDTLSLRHIRLADRHPRIVLPATLKHLSIVDCGLESLALELADGQPLSTASFIDIDLRRNALAAIPDELFELSDSIASLDVSLNRIEMLDVDSEHPQQLTAWLRSGVLRVDPNESTASTIRSLTTASSASSSSASSSSGGAAGAGLVPGPSAGASNASRDGVTLLLAILAPCLAVAAFVLAYCLYRSKRLLAQGSGSVAATGATPSCSSLEPIDHAKLLSIASGGGGSDLQSPSSSGRPSSASSPSGADVKMLPLAMAVPLSARRTPSKLSRGASYTSLASPTPREPSAFVRSFQSVLRVTSVLGDDDELDPDELDEVEVEADDERASAVSDDSSGGPVEGDCGQVLDAEAAMRLGARRRLRRALEQLLAGAAGDTPVVVTVNRNEYVVARDAVVDEAAGACCAALEVRAFAVAAATQPPVVLKVFAAPDEPLARREWNALRRARQWRRRASVPAPAPAPVARELMDAQLHKQLRPDRAAGRPLSASVLVLAAAPASASASASAPAPAPGADSYHAGLRAAFACVAALRALHASGLVHCGLHGGAVRGGRFLGLELATRRGERAPSVHPLAVHPRAAEAMAPELARHLLARRGASALEATPALDAWSVGVLLLRLVARGPGAELEELAGAADASVALVRLAAPAFRGFPRSLDRFARDDAVRELAAQCLALDPARRPTLAQVARHRCWRAVSAAGGAMQPVAEVGAGAEDGAPALQRRKSVVVFRPVPPKEQRGPERGPERGPGRGPELGPALEPGELQPPSLWLLLPPAADHPPADAAAEDWAAWLEAARAAAAAADGELRFPLLPLCEHAACGAGGGDEGAGGCAPLPAAPSRGGGGVRVPESLLPLVVPVVQETLLLLRARAAAVLGGCGPKNHSPERVAAVNGLRAAQWGPLAPLYAALQRAGAVGDCLAAAPVLAPLEALLAAGDAARVLAELQALVFSPERREFVRGLLDVLAVAAPEDEDEDEDAGRDRDRAAQPDEAALRRYDGRGPRVEHAGEAAPLGTAARWLCAAHRPRPPPPPPQTQTQTQPPLAALAS